MIQILNKLGTAPLWWTFMGLLWLFIDPSVTMTCTAAATVLAKMRDQ